MQNVLDKIERVCGQKQSLETLTIWTYQITIELPEKHLQADVESCWKKYVWLRLHKFNTNR